MSEEEKTCTECGVKLEKGDDGYGTTWGTCSECANVEEDLDITIQDIESFLKDKKITSRTVYQIGLEWIEKLNLNKESRWTLEGRIRNTKEDFRSMLIAFIVDTVNSQNKSVIYHSDPIDFEYMPWHINYKDIEGYVEN